MTCRRSATAALGLLLVSGACATTENPTPIAAQLLATAEEQAAAGAAEEALASIEPLAGDQCPERMRDRRDLVKATAEVGREEYWDAFLILERFSDDYPLSDLRPQVMDLLWSISAALLERDTSFWVFWSDRAGARAVLEHLITRHPDTQRLADALRILGDMAFDSQDFEMAQARYREIILERPDSDWRFYANFRFAMSIAAGLRGPEYDLDGMKIAATELRTFLRSAPENPTMVREAEAALAQVLEWQIQRHLKVIAYYRTLGNLEGQLHHARLATRDELSGSPGYDEAAALLERLEAERARAAAPAPNGGRP